ncbi:hypothetical protein CBR_g31054 [Chara braunii]|uniref:Reverse transcriptase domain-containing protein n=1 Tax=Chara braunii TaxID=69332 RepID=A0A388LE63_CHABU|nr:hypothetical protein CBR_g31054 [Chara braunii]|eukprot:GBG80595.1 hypothetical protein CBR_g31054 [Chara braunii]
MHVSHWLQVATRALTLTNTSQDLWCSALATKLRGSAFSAWEIYYTHRTRAGEAPTLADFTTFLHDRYGTLHDATDALDRVTQTQWRGSSAPSDLERHIRVFQDARLICDEALLPEVLLTNRFVVSLPTDYRIELWRQSFASAEQAYEAARQYQKMRNRFSDTPSSSRSTTAATQSRDATRGRSSLAGRFRRSARPGASFFQLYSSLEYGEDASAECDPTLGDASEDIELRDVIQYHLDGDTVPVAECLLMAMSAMGRARSRVAQAGARTPTVPQIDLPQGYVPPRGALSPEEHAALEARRVDGTFRLCIDYRGLNRYTVKNSYHMPSADELFDRLADNRFFTKIDLRSGYHQIPVVTEDQPKTAFRSRFGHYELTVMPFGLTNAPATFQTAMNDIFRDILEEYVLVYLNDILVYSRTLEDYIRHLRDVLQRLRKNDFYAKLSKCRFAQRKVDFLGHHVSDQGFHMDDAKITAIAE